IADGIKAGNREAALKAFQVMGEHLGDAMANLITLTDGLIVLGGGIAGAARYFMPSVMESLNGRFDYPSGDPMTRLIQRVYNLDDTGQRHAFLARTGREIKVPGSGRIQYYDDQPKSAVGISRLGASRAIALGAYSFALHKLNTE
ncbi:MAG: hypothetical protein AMS26_22875, partial [Bacteroides sp. SM23_62]